MKRSELKKLIVECKDELAQEEISQLVMEDDVYKDAISAEEIDGIARQKDLTIERLEDIIKFLELSVIDYKHDETNAYTIAKQLETRSRLFSENHK
jgi:hypothetical protein